MNEPLRVAAVGVGRIGFYHALHVQELARENGSCVLSAIVDGYGDFAERVAARLQLQQDVEIHTFQSVEELASAAVADAAVIASRTADHQMDARTLIDAGLRVLLEKPISDSLSSTHEFVDYLNNDDQRRMGLMLAFNRRFDLPAQRARELLAEGRIGRLFKIVSILEDPHGPPDGYSSSGLLSDMAVHCADQVIWLTGQRPRSAIGAGACLYNQKVSSVAEDFDDAFVQMWLEDDVIAQVQVSRNHVVGYRNELTLYGDEGMIQVGRFHQNLLEVPFEAYHRTGVIENTMYAMRDYGREVPMFIERFGPSYSAEIAHFVDQCCHGKPFTVDQNDGLSALQVVEAARRSVQVVGDAVVIEL